MYLLPHIGEAVNRARLFDNGMRAERQAEGQDPYGRSDDILLAILTEMAERLPATIGLLVLEIPSGESNLPRRLQD